MLREMIQRETANGFELSNGCDVEIGTASYKAVNLVVIDDIDTLTTRGVEAGFDFLYSVLWRSKRRSKLLYTLRNAPSQSLANAIEVPGLEEGDYEEFVEVCRSQFRFRRARFRSRT